MATNFYNSIYIKCWEMQNYSTANRGNQWRLDVKDLSGILKQLLYIYSVEINRLHTERKINFIVFII